MADHCPGLPLEQRIGALRDGEVTHHGEPVGSMPLTVQPPRRPVVTADDIVERIRESWITKDIRTHYDGCWNNHAGCAVVILLNEIEALRAVYAAECKLADKLYQELHGRSFQEDAS